MCGRAGASYCTTATGRQRNRNRCDTGRLGVWGKELFSDRGRRSNTLLGIIWSRVRRMRCSYSSGCVGSTGGGGIGGRDWDS